MIALILCQYQEMEMKLEYDLTTFLSTIASASSGIVAILGGFIASKLISISGERDTVLLRLKHIEEEIDYRTREREKAQFENDEDDALDFIREHAKDMWNGLSLEDAYKTADAPRISRENILRRSISERFKNKYGCKLFDLQPFLDLNRNFIKYTKSQSYTHRHC